MSIASMTVTTKANPDKERTFFYKKGIWGGNLSVANLNFNTANDMINYLNNKYNKVYFFRMNFAKTFGGQFIKPNKIYQKELEKDEILNCIMVHDGNSLKLITTKAKRAEEFIAFNSSVQETYVPVFIYKDTKEQVKLLNFK